VHCLRCGHALTLGHSRTILALVVASSGTRFASALQTAAFLSTVRISMSVAGGRG
jgi:hypothetical protein